MQELFSFIYCVFNDAVCYAKYKGWIPRYVMYN